jgi:acetyl esterase
VYLDAQADALCERIQRAGSGTFAGRTVAEVRRAGLELAGTWSLHDDDLAIVSYLSRNGDADVETVATAVGLPVSLTRAHLEGLRRGGFARMRERPGLAPQWSAVIGGRRRARQADGALAALVDRPPPGLQPEPGGRRDVDLGDGVAVRIYRPAAPDGVVPLLLFIHGGAFVSGTLDDYDNICESMADLAGCVVISLDYRLAPEHPFPAAVEDAQRALRWVLEQAPALGGDARRLAVMGDSAGGNLATVAATIAGVEGWCHPVLQVLLYPVLDAALASPSVEQHAAAPLFSRADMEWMYGHYGVPADDWRASPLAAQDLTGAPPTLVITADVDPARDDGLRYAERLRAAGVDVDAMNYEGMMHGFFAFAPALDKASDARARVAAALRQRFDVGP